jgi:hypothetical protein
VEVFVNYLKPREKYLCSVSGANQRRYPMSNETREKADEAKKALESAENMGRVARKKLDDIKDADGSKKADAVVKIAKEAKEYIERKLGKEGN